MIVKVCVSTQSLCMTPNSISGLMAREHKGSQNLAHFETVVIPYLVSQILDVIKVEAYVVLKLESDSCFYFLGSCSSGSVQEERWYFLIAN